MSRSTYVALKKDIRAALPTAVYHELLSACTSAARSNTIVLWGAHREPGFVEHMMLLLLAHDVLGWSFDKIKNKVVFPHPIAVKTIQRNSKLLRRVLGTWGREQVDLGTKEDWLEAVKEVERPAFLSLLHLWIDSTDINIERKRGRSKKSEHWSGKNGRPARRYMVLSDARGVVRRFWGGYSPKLYDGHWVAMNKEWLREHLSGVGLIGDSHFHSAREEVPGVTIFAPKPEQTERDLDSGADISKLTKEEQTRNAQIRFARGRVEQVFAPLRDQLLILKRPWAEDLREMDEAVAFGLGLHNFKKAKLE